LQPLVKSKEALEKGMKISLFERLCKENYENVCRLRYQVYNSRNPKYNFLKKLHFQYRMNNDIMYLSNTLIYNNSLISANSEVAESKLILDLEKM
jgi:superfamily I DNA and/or RNA helicase